MVEKLSSQFDLVISFQGSVSCSPKLRSLIIERWDERFLFDEWNEKVMLKLWKQQNERLKEGLPLRSILVIVDDISMSPTSRDQLAHLCQRGRHCGISVFISCVSYTVVPKAARRSLDFCFVFDLPMYSCKKILLTEFAKQPQAAEFYLQKIPQYTSLVLNTSKNQELFYFKIGPPGECGKFESERLLSPSSPAHLAENPSKISLFDESIEANE